MSIERKRRCVIDTVNDLCSQFESVVRHNNDATLKLKIALQTIKKMAKAYETRTGCSGRELATKCWRESYEDIMK